MSSSAQVIESEAPKTRKYDGRKSNGGKRINAGAKPAWAKHLSRNTAAELFKQCDLKARLAQTIDTTKDERLRFEVIKYVWDRYEGRPFVAINPEEIKRAPSIQDNRLQLAIQNLILPAIAKNKRKKADSPKQLTAGVSTEAPSQ